MGAPFWQFSSGILILTSTLAYLEEQISHKGPRAAQNRGARSNCYICYYCLVFPTRVFPNPKPVFFGYFPLPETRFFSTTNSGYLKNLELLLHSSINDSDNIEVADWRGERPN